MTPQETAEQAVKLVSGARSDVYGHPLDNFSRTALIWTAILGTHVTAEQVALCMVGVKLAREANEHTDDNCVDAVGYMLTLQMLLEERTRRILDEMAR